MNLLKQTIITAAALTLSVSVVAKEYLSLDVGKATISDISSQLKEAGANFESDYGYKGYTDLTMFKINNYSGFSKYGSVSSAWLHFDPSKTLYKVEVTYADAGNTYKMFKDALSAKYRVTQNSSRGFEKTTAYSDGDFSIVLNRNEFGFGSDQKTTLTYEFQPAIPAVIDMRAQIEEVIRKKNAAQAGDL